MKQEHDLSELAEQLLQAADDAGLSLATAESCTAQSSRKVNVDQR